MLKKSSLLKWLSLKYIGRKKRICSFSVKIMRKEGRERGNKIRRRKRPSPFSILKSSPHSFLSLKKPFLRRISTT